MAHHDGVTLILLTIAIYRVAYLWQSKKGRSACWQLSETESIRIKQRG